MPPNGIEEEIVRLLEKRPEGLKISDIARSLGIQRQTISKYVYGLKLAGVVEYREVGRSKVYFLKKGERKKFKFALLIALFLSLNFPIAFAQTQSHPLSEITPIDVNLDMFLKNITNVSYVGIGLVNPLYALDVSGSGRISTNLIIGGWLNSTYLNVSSGLIVTPSGNVGIGTTSPVKKLDVVGDINATAVVYGDMWCDSSYDVCANPLNDGYLHIRNKANSNYKGLAASEFYHGNSGIYIQGGSGYLDLNAGSIRATQFVDRNNTAFYLDPASTSELLNVNLNNGYLGEVGYIQGYGTLNYYPAGYATNPAHVFKSGTGSGWADRLSIGGNAAIVDVSVSNSNFVVNSNQFYVRASDGNVGIGTIAPVKKLDVVGDINATGYVYGLTGLCIGTDCRTSWQVSAISPWDNSTTWTFIREGYPLNVNVSNILFVNSTTGNVGIGITNPGHTLDVQGSLRLRDLSTPSAVNGTIYFDTTLKRFRCYQGAWTDCITTFTEPATGLWNLTGSLLYPKDLTWNLGIGTATPTEKLEVQGRLLVASNNPFELEPSDQTLDIKGNINATGTIYGTLANNIVTTASISDGAVTTSKIADSAVTTAKIADGAITNSKIALNAINTSQIIDLTIQTSDIADSAITSAKIADGAIVDADISTTAAINPSKITSGTFGGTGNYVFPANIKINGNNILDSSGATRITLGATTAIAGTTNLNIAGGYLQIGGINVIDPSRNILNINWVNATNFNASDSIRASRFLIGNTQVIDSSRNLVNINRLDIGATNVIDSSRNIINVNWVNATNLNLTSNAYIGNSLFFVPDVQLFRGAANRLDLASGNSLNLISGNLQIGGINVITSERLIQAANGSASSPAYSFISDTNTGIYRADEDNLRFVTGGLDRVTIDSAGRVGINTAIPTEQLEVQGRLLVASSNPFELEPSDNILDVKGSINATVVFYVPKNSTQPFACDSTKESAIFFNTTDKKFYGCTGTAWVIIGTQA